MKKIKEIANPTKKEIVRIKTGIPGFDELIQGGFPKNASILVCGGPGCGKTIFALEYILRGARDFNEKGLYVTFEQRTEALRDQASQFGWNTLDLEKSGKIKLLSISIDKLSKETIKEIQDMVKKEGITRLVIDSLSTLVINAPIYTAPSEMAVQDVVGDNVIFSPPIIGDYIVKRFVYSFIEKLRALDCTSILISEASEKGEFISRDTLSEFVCDGVILINFESLGGEFARSLIVRKMRQTKNNEDIHPLEIGINGLIVHGIVQ
jgi:circadian clock protein KaiC